MGPQISWLYKKRVKECWVSLWPIVYRAHSIAALYNCTYLWVKVFKIIPEFKILRLTFQPQNAELGRL